MIGYSVSHGQLVEIAAHVATYDKADDAIAHAERLGVIFSEPVLNRLKRWGGPYRFETTDNMAVVLSKVTQNRER